MSELAQQLIAECKRTQSTKLDLGNCGLTGWPEELFDCVWLEELNMGNYWWNEEEYEWVKSKNEGAANHLAAISPGLKKLNRLRLLGLSGYDEDYKSEWEIETILPGVLPASLLVLDLSGNQINEIKGLEQLAALNSLHLHSNRITEIKGLEQLTALNNLHLNSNQITEIKGLEQLTALNSLHLESNRITEIKGLEQLTALNSLNLRGNQITEIKGLERLTALNSLDLNWNYITEIKGLEHLPELSKLELSYNQIKYCEKLQLLTSLAKLVLYHNPLKDIPQGLLGYNYNSNCLPDALNWWEETADKTKSRANTLVKLQLIGNGNVGKSSVVEALKKGICTTEFDTTHGVVIAPLEFPVNNTENPIHFQVWDFGGQEIYHGTHRLFIGSESIQLIVFDNTTEQLADERQPQPDRKVDKELVFDQPTRHYLELCQQESPLSKRIILQNKVDIEGKNTRTAKLAVEYESDFTTVSATTGKGIEILRAQLAETGRELLHYGMLMPQSWLDVQQYFLDNLEKPEPERQRLLSREEFENICAVYKVLPQSASSLLKLLHHIGIVYTNKDILQDTIIADQRWALEAIYKPLERGSPFYEELRDDLKGRVRAKTLFHAFGNDYKPAEKWLFLHFMQSCGLCFRLKTGQEKEDENSYYIFPRFLPGTETPAARDIWRNATNIEIYECRLEYLDYHRIQQFIVSLGNKTQLEYIWQNGLLVVTDSGKFKVEANQKDAIIKVTIETSAVSDYLLLIIEAFDKGKQEEWIKDGKVINREELRNRKIRNKEEKKQEQTEVSVIAEEEQKNENKKTLEESIPTQESTPIRTLVVSYASEDKTVVEFLKSHFAVVESNYNIQLLYDKHCANGFGDWDEKILSMFNDADGFIILVSKNYQNDQVKKYIWEKEIKLIEERFKDTDQNPGLFIYCLIASPIADLHHRLKKFHLYGNIKNCMPKADEERDEFVTTFIQETIIENFIKLTSHDS